ncbi:EGF-like domain-containing protein [Tieghemostelium lacteum]|uniref:EGF-like domain-containing protein n=1 Tax=Tieghemostelium lacteum TaxID=361077 RepID=A0A151Z896_TIELA|nr:EGF-like domain-containing protein [Tieghemostelium lacteum]|eukprot:KYQ90014.1 EGF-like domain-containing protein [Tieghemostelium lacteum]
MLILKNPETIFVDLTTPYANDVYSTYADKCGFDYLFSIAAENGDLDLDCANDIQVTVYGPITISTVTIVTGSATSCFGQLTITPPLESSGYFVYNVKSNFSLGNISFDCTSLPYPIQQLDPPPKFRLMDLQTNIYQMAILTLNLTKGIPMQSLITSFTTGFSCDKYVLSYTQLQIQCSLIEFVNIPTELVFNITDPLGRISSFGLESFVKNVVTKTVNHYFDSTTSLLIRKLFYTEAHVRNFDISMVFQVQVPNYLSQSRIAYGNMNDFTIIFPIEVFTLFPINLSTFYVNGSAAVEVDLINYDNNALAPTMTLTNPNPSITIDAIISGITLNNYDERPINYKYGDLSRLQIPDPYPYGVTRRINEAVTMKLVTRPKDYQRQLTLSTNSGNIFDATVGTIFDTVAPSLDSVEYIQVSSVSYIVRVSASDALSGVYSIQIGVLKLSLQDLISGTPNNGVFEKYVDERLFFNFEPSMSILLFDYAGNSQGFLSTSTGLPYSYFTPNQLPFASAYLNSLFQITDVSYMINDIDLSVVGCQNTIYIGLSSNITLDRDTPLKLNFYGIPTLRSEVIIAKWNEKFQKYTADFYLPPRLFGFDSIIVYIAYKNAQLFLPALKNSFQLRAKSEYADQMPPLVTEIISSSDLNNQTGGTISWSFKISDPYNGLKSGKIQVVSDLEPFLPIEFLIKPNANQNPLLDYYNVSITIPPNCVSQTFFINSIELTDNGMQTSLYRYKGKQLPTPSFSALMLFLNDSASMDKLSITTNCMQLRTDTTPPTITSFIIGTKSSPVVVTAPLDADRTINAVFTVTDTESEIDTIRFIPVCYLFGTLFDKISVQSYLVNTSSKTATFQCDIVIPYRFDYTSKVLVGVYGYSDNQLNIGGTPPNLPEMTTTIAFFAGSSPYIQSVEREGTTLTIVGNNFATLGTSVTVGPKTYQVVPLGSIVIIIKDIIPITVPSNVTVIVSSQASNDVLIQPDPPINTPSPSTTASPNTPCPGTPQCGGSSNGQCINGKCQCIKPWIGVDCLSQNIITPSPTINTTNPDIDNNFNTTFPDGETVTLKSLISIVSLKELKPDGTIVIEHPFTQWVYTNTTSLQSNSNIQEFTYKTNITNNNLLTPISVTLQYFKQPETIIFANEKLEMLASTIKYRIDISKYNFSSGLNTLQFVMSAALESQGSSCSAQESGDIDNENLSEFVKLQVDTHSLYGRFIKRGIIDNRIQQISNTIITNSVPENPSSNSISQTFIGINIPNFRSSVTIDPDFSILIDTTPASEKPDSICAITDTTESKLSKSQLAGIIIGAVAFATIIIVSVSYYFYKKNQSKQFAKNIENKLKNMD